LARLSRRLLLALLSAAGASFSVTAVQASDELPTIGRPPGRPRITIDRLTFPKMEGGADYVRHLTLVIRREARRADWGAGRKNKIALRFVVEQLTLNPKGNALEVSCSARGELPGGRRARSRLVYGGDPKHPRKLVERVLEIVARGVVGRLAELERTRRSA
jgi:hypothetical protein